MAAESSGIDIEAYAENAPLMALFGTPARTKILNVLIADRGRDLTTSEIARGAGIARSTVYEHIEWFQTLGVIEQTRKTQNEQSPRYQLNEESEFADLLYQLEGVTLKRLLELDGVFGDEDKA